MGETKTMKYITFYLLFYIIATAANMLIGIISFAITDIMYEPGWMSFFIFVLVDIQILGAMIKYRNKAYGY